MADPSKTTSSPVLTPDMIAFLVKEDEIPISEILSKLTPAEKKAFISSGLMEDPEIVEVMGDPLLPMGAGKAIQAARGAQMGAQAATKGYFGQAAGKLGSMSDEFLDKAVPYAGAGVGAILGGMVKHPLSGWSIGKELGRQVRGKMKAPPVKDPRNLLRGADSASSKAERVAGGARVDPANLQRGKEGLSRVPRDGGIVEGSGKPMVTSNASTRAGEMPANLSKGGPATHGRAPRVNTPSNVQKTGTSDFTETEKRAAMFGGVKAPGLAPKPNQRGPLSIQEEAELLIQEILKGKTGGALPNNAPRGAVAGKTRLKKPKK